MSNPPSTASSQPTSPPPFSPVRHWPSILRFAGVTVIGLALDLWTKWLAATHLKDTDGVAVIPGWLHFDYTENHGAVFGIGWGYRWVFVGVSLAAIIFLTTLFSRSGRQRAYQFLLGMLLAGVLGNLYDRIVYGYVRDMIHALPSQRWPGTWALPLLNYPGPGREIFPYIFNIADSLLCVGVTVLLIYSFFAAPTSKPSEQSPPTAEVPG